MSLSKINPERLPGLVEKGIRARSLHEFTKSHKRYEEYMEQRHSEVLEFQTQTTVNNLIESIILKNSQILDNHALENIVRDSLVGTEICFSCGDIKYLGKIVFVNLQPMTIGVKFSQWPSYDNSYKKLYN